MAWKKIEQPKVCKLTHRLANEFAGMTPAPNDRPLSAIRSKRLESEIVDGRFRTCEWASAYCEETKQTYRVNGKHTSTLFSQLNGEAPKDTYIIVERYHCETVQDVAALYATFDKRDSVRTPADINLAFAACDERFVAIPRRILQLAVTGMAFSQWETSYMSRPCEVRAALLLEHPEFVLWLADIMLGVDAIKYLRRGPVSAAMFATWSKDREQATKFWTLVRDASHESPQHVTRVLREHLIENPLRAAGNSRGPTGVRAMYVRSLHAWNAWRKGSKARLKYAPEDPTPTVI